MTVGPLARGELVVRPAIAGEARVVHGLLVACGRDMVARHRLHHWDPPFPLELVEVDVAERDVVLVEVDDDVVATFTLGAVPDEWHEDLYAAVSWTPARSPVYLNRLAVDPRRQRRGLGARCLSAAHVRAAAVGHDAVRLDCVRAVPGRQTPNIQTVKWEEMLHLPLEEGRLLPPSRLRRGRGVGDARHRVCRLEPLAGRR